MRGANTVVVSNTGGNTATAAVDGAISLDTIDVSGGGGAAAAADLPYQTPGSSAYVTSEQIQRIVGESSADIFKDTPGVLSGSNRNGASLNPNIRGLQGMNRVATSIDGAEQATSSYRGYYGVDNRTYVDPDLLSGVSITKGPSGSGQGASAIGGTVDMETLTARDVLKSGNSYGIRLRGTIMNNSIEPMNGIVLSQSPPVPGQDDGRTDRPELFNFVGKSGSFAAAYAKDAVEVVAAISRRQTGNYFAGTHGPTTFMAPGGLVLPLSPGGHGTEVLNTSEDSLSTLLKATVRFGDGHRLRLAYVHYESDYGETTPSVIRGSGYRQLPLSSVATDTFTTHYSWKPSFTELIDFKINSWFTNIDENSLQADSIGVLKRKTNSQTIGVNASNTSRFGTIAGPIAISYGGSYVHEDVEPTEPSTNNSYYPLSGRRQIASAFTKAEWQPQSWIKFDGGLQYLRYDVEDTSGFAGIPPIRLPFTGYSGDEVSPSYGVTVMPLDGVQLFAKYSSGYRPPSIRESTWNSSGFYFNPALRPEQASNWEFGANYLTKSVLEPGDKLRFKLAYFDNETEDYIGRVFGQVAPNIFNWAYRLTNFHSVTLKGIELTAGYDARKYFVSTSLNYYTEFKYCRTAATCGSAAQQSDYMVNQVPPKFTAATTVGVRVFDERLTLGARHTFVDKSIGDFVVDPSDFNPFTLLKWPSYHIVDLFAEWKIDEDFYFSLNADNITDRFYVDPLSNAILPAPGRTLRAGLTMKF
jgi:hemoglobin/transferrin/lactoferrin receptor protein